MITKKSGWGMLVLLLSCFVFSVTSCSEDATVDATDTDGTKKDPTASSTGTTSKVTLKSKPYSLSSASAKMGGPLYAVTDSSADITEFSFCITKMQVTPDPIMDSTVDAPAGSVEAVLGLIDVSDPSTDTTWGTIELPDGMYLKELMVEVHQDPENCSDVEYSLNYNGNMLQKDLEFKFQFNPSIKITPNDVLSLALDNIAQTFHSAHLAGQLDDENIGAYVEDLVETAKESTEDDATEDTSSDS